MRRKRNHFMWSILLLGGWLFLSCSTPPPSGARINPNDYPFLNPATPRNDMIWRKFQVPDFEVFYGNPQDSRTCGFGFFIGGFPNFHPATNAVVASATLGAFDVDWYESVDAHAPQFHREAVFEYRTRATWAGSMESRYRDRIHVWIYGETQQQVLEMTDFLAGLELFRQRPAPGG